MRTIPALTAALVLLAAGGCAARRPAPPPTAPPAARSTGRSAEALRAGLEHELSREPYLPMLSQEEAKKAMPAHARWPELPTLMLVAARQPKSMEAVLATAKTLRREGGLDNRLLNDVFWVVSSANDCFY
jgi:hypothetical protein